MHLAVDALGIKHSGGATVLLDFLNAALDDQRVTRVTLFCSPRASRRFDLPLSPKLHSEERPLAERSYLVRVWWFQVLLAGECRRIGADRLICMVGAGRAGAASPHVTLIQQSLPFDADFMRIAPPGYRARMMVLKRLMRSSCLSATRVIAQTPTMKSWISEQFALPTERISVILPATSPLPAPESTQERLLAEGDGPKLLYVGADSAYKNVRTVITGLAALRAAVPGAKLYLTWPLDHEAANVPGVVCLGYLSRSLLAKAYAEATLLVMPSLAETVGLPMLEAMRAGLPVLVADRPYAHDIAEDAACFFDPFSPQDFAARAQHLLQDAVFRDGLIEKGQRLIARREASNPYQKMLDLALGCG